MKPISSYRIGYQGEIIYINLVEIHPQLSNKGIHPVDGSLVHCGPSWRRDLESLDCNQLQVELFGFPIICHMYLYLCYGICTFAFFCVP
jgi:hypothetical protein